MVTTTSEATTASVVSTAGRWPVMSMPTSAIAATAAGLTWSAGSGPAGGTSTVSPARCRSQPAAICDRPALCTQTNSTLGRGSLTTVAPPAWGPARPRPAPRGPPRRLGGPHDRAVHAVGDLVGEHDLRIGEAGPPQTVPVLGHRQRAGDAPDVAAPLGPLCGSEVVLGDDVGDAEPAARRQHPEGLGQHARLVR